MEHVLFECTASTAIQTVWENAKKLWDMKGSKTPWPKNLRLGHITGSGLIKIKNEPGRTRLLRILLTESAHLIWKTRCTQTIEWKNLKTHTPTQVHNKWLYTINKKLKTDKILTNKANGIKALDKTLILDTW